MPSKKRPRKGSLQFWPRKRANKILPSANWKAIDSDKIKNLKGFIGYKAGMASASVQDSTPDSRSKGKRIVVPVTIIECPHMKIMGVRFYKDGVVAKDVLAENLDKELKRKIKVPKKKVGDIDSVKQEDYDDVSVICYSIVKKTGLKKKPDVAEFGLKGSLDEKINFIKENLSKEISVLDIFEKGQLVDFRAVTKGKGFQGTVKRFGVGLKSHKSEKGRRRPGSLGPWHPARVTFRVPMAGQTGFHTRVVYNNLVLDLGNDLEKYKSKLTNIKNYGNVKNDYIVVKGSVQGPAKRQVLITAPLRETKKKLKQSMEVIELR